ncbi:MAG: sialidase family protein, partial [Candidatus Saccharimonadales bacterium]
RRALASGVDGLPLANGDPKAVYDQFGNLFLAYLTEGHLQSVVIAVSQDNGQTFTIVDVLNDPDSVDQPSIAVGPDTSGQEGSVWVTFQTGNNEIMAAHASVSGLGLVSSFSEVQVAPSPGSVASRNFGDIAVGPNGQVLVAYEAPALGPGPAGIFVNLDSGATQPESYGTPVLATTTHVGGFAPIPPQSQRSVDAEGNLAWDLSTSSHRGRVYLVYTDSPEVNSPDTSIFVRYSDDDGKTWSERVSVDDNHAGKSQFMPSIAVDPSNGDVAVSWYDARHDADGVKAEYFVAVSINGGLSFSPSAAVSLGASDATDPGLNLFGRQNQFGDYSAVVMQAGIVYPAWTDNSAELALNPDRPQFEVAAARAPTVHVADAPLSATSLDISDDVGAEGELFTADLATFTDADSNADLALYTATIDWGDNTKLVAGETRSDSGKFIVSGTHAYKEEGSYTITVSIDDKGGASAKITIDVDVEDADLTAVGPTFKPAEGLPFNGVVATFTDANPNAKIGDYWTPTINWGDGAATDGTIIFDGSAALAWSS